MNICSDVVDLEEDDEDPARRAEKEGGVGLEITNCR
jgi:hypothetical protein